MPVDNNMQICATFRVQRSAKVDAQGCVNAAGKLGRSDKQQQ